MATTSEVAGLQRALGNRAIQRLARSGRLNLSTRSPAGGRQLSAWLSTIAGRTLSRQEDDEPPPIDRDVPVMPHVIPMEAPAVRETELTPAIGAAQASQRKWSIPASVTLAQFILESNSGRAMPAGSNNPFGIKAGAGEPFVEAWTHETVDGQDVQIKAKFRKYSSMTEAFDKHAELLATAPQYASARAVANDPDGFAHALTGVYATAPHYGDLLIARMKAGNLYQYDLPP
jgi:hypothetical protein